MDNDNEAPPQLPPISEEQKLAVLAFLNGNLLLDSVAGSGKTTTALHFARVLQKLRPSATILHLTFNAKLKINTKEKKDSFSLDNMEVRSYHSLAVRYFNKKCYTDKGLQQYLKMPMSDDTVLPSYDYVIIDEAQDMAPRYFTLLLRILGNAKICIIGDKLQCIYKYSGSSDKFITHATEIFTTNTFEWSSLKLTTSYRLTTQMCDFINKCILREDRLVSNRPGTKPRYVICDIFSTSALTHEVNLLLQKHKPQDIFILAFTMGKETGPVNKLANALSASGIPVYIANDSPHPLNDRVLEKKIVFSTFHQAKGLERRAVILLGFDKSYYHYYTKSPPSQKCPNEFYVALTRAIDDLVIIHSSNKPYMPFLGIHNKKPRDSLAEYCTIVGELEQEMFSPKNPKPLYPAEITRHLSVELIDVVTSVLQVRTINPVGETINIDTISRQKIISNGTKLTIFEEVSDITGVAIPAYYQFISTNKMYIAESLDEKIPDRVTPKWLLQMATKYITTSEGKNYREKQITKYDWLSIDALISVAERLELWISKNATYEKEITGTLSDKSAVGRIDIFDNSTIWEIKCTTSITPEHIIQTAIYLYLYCKTTTVRPACRIFNVITNEIVEISAPPDKLEQAIKLLICNRYHANKDIEDENLMELIEKIKKTYILPEDVDSLYGCKNCK